MLEHALALVGWQHANRAAGPQGMQETAGARAGAAGHAGLLLYIRSAMVPHHCLSVWPLAAGTRLVCLSLWRAAQATWAKPILVGGIMCCCVHLQLLRGAAAAHQEDDSSAM